jgi:hypothetical protein
MNEEKSEVVIWITNFIRQINLLISENLSEIQPILLPLPFATLIMYELQMWVLPFKSGEARWIVAVIGGIALEFFGLTALDVAQRAKAYNIIREPRDPKIPIWPSWLALATYIIVAAAMLTIGAVAPGLGYDVKKVAPALMYGFILVLPFGYWFISARSTMNTIYARRERDKAEAKQAEESAWAMRLKELELLREKAEIDRLNALNEQERAKAEAIKRDAEARATEAEAKRKVAEARQTEAEASRTRAERMAPVAPTAPVSRGKRVGNGAIEKIRARDLSFEEIDRMRGEGYVFDPLTDTFKEKHQVLVAAFGTRQFTGPEVAQLLGCSGSSALQTMRVLYADGQVAVIGNGIYQFLPEGRPN